MNNIALKIETAFRDTKHVVEGFCDMAKEISGPIAGMLWLASATLPVIWCLAIARGLGAF